MVRAEKQRIKSHMERNADYMRRRASEERAAADRATNCKARDLHLELAARYLEAANGRTGSSEISPNGNGSGSVAPPEFRIIG